jgi:nitric oxide reductase subunit B
MAITTIATEQGSEDRVSNVLKWVLFAVAVSTFALLGWTTDVTYRTAPPRPGHFVEPGGAVVMTAADIEDGKASFQQADLMDYGSIYGMGSYFGEDYTAEYLVKLGAATADNIAKARYGRPFASLDAEQQAAAKSAMQRALKDIDLTRSEVVLPEPVAAAVAMLKSEIAELLLHHDFIKGWTQAYSLDQQSAIKTADFILYSALTTIARRPGSDISWTQNWPFEPLVGNSPTAETFRWTWISFSFTFFCFGLVLFVYHRYLANPDDAPMIRCWPASVP